MHASGQQLISGLLIALLLAFTVPGASSASTQPAIPLEQAIQIVRLNFEIPSEYTDFNSSFNQSESGQAWYLVWNKPGQTGGNFSAQVDAVTGEVISMNTWKPETDTPSRIPAVSWEQAQQIGTELLQRLIPNRISSLVMIPDPEPIPLTAFGPTTYTINWRRVANHIPLDGVGAWVTVNASDGQVQGYSLNWSHLPLPDPDGIISPAAAQQIFIKEGLVQLQYIVPERLVPLAAGTRPDPRLVYRLDHPSNGAIDAFTGSPIIPEYGPWVSGGGADGLGGKAESSAPTVAPVLTPEEQAEIIQISGLISQEQAAASIIKWSQAGDALELRSASLDQDWRDSDLRIWNLGWSSGANLDSQASKYLYGRVNARTGELLSFSLGLPADDNASSAISYNAAQSIAEKFLRSLQGERFAQFQLDSNSLNSSAADKMPPVSQLPAWSFRYIRTVNGINFPDNGIEITIDRTHQKIIAYNLNWLYEDLPAATDIIDLEQANQLYLQAAPLTLTYAPYYSAAKGSTVMRLVYQPQVPAERPSFRMLDAFSGALLDSQGQPVSTSTQAHFFNDIAGNFAEKEISLLGKSGLMIEYGDAFHPEEAVKLAAVLRSMLGASMGIDAIRSLTDAEIVQMSLELGWIKEALPADSTVTRGFLARLMVRFLDLEYLANIPEIYQLNYRDYAALATDLQGYAALCWGLGIIRGDGLDFQAPHVISRAEAAAALVRSLRVSQ